MATDPLSYVGAVLASLLVAAVLAVIIFLVQAALGWGGVERRRPAKTIDVVVRPPITFDDEVYPEREGDQRWI